MLTTLVLSLYCNAFKQTPADQTDCLITCNWTMVKTSSNVYDCNAFHARMHALQTVLAAQVVNDDVTDGASDGNGDGGVESAHNIDSRAIVAISGADSNGDAASNRLVKFLLRGACGVDLLDAEVS
jgi:hypothetical protein